MATALPSVLAFLERAASALTLLTMHRLTWPFVTGIQVMGEASLFLSVLFASVWSPAMPDRWIERFKVPSSSSDSIYTVAQDAQGVWGCSCPAWTRNRARLKNGQCKHILQVLDDPDAYRDDPPEEPQIVLANVRQVEIVDLGRGHLQAITPLVPFGGGDATHFCATVMYDLHQAGISWKTLGARYDLVKKNSGKAIEAYVQERGRLIYGPWVEGRGFVGYERV